MTEVPHPKTQHRTDVRFNLRVDQIKHDLFILQGHLNTGYIGRTFNPLFSELWVPKTQPIIKQQTRGFFLSALKQWLERCEDPHLDAFLPTKPTRKIAAFRLNLMHQQRVVRLTLHHFNGSSEIWQRRCNRLKEYLKTADALVIDLRNNPGGKRSHMLDLVRVITGDHNDLGPNRTLYRDSFSNPSVKELLENNCVWRPLQPFSLPGAPNQSTVLKQHRSPKNKPTVFNGPLFFLINGQTASTAEHMIHALHHYPQRCIIGTPSLGAISFYNRGLCILPHSKLWVTIPTAYICYHDLSPHRNKRIRPHIQTKTEIETNQVLRNEIRQRCTAQ